MTRTPPNSVKDFLRAEVGFGCPVNGCRLPFLEFHHFDPPWSEREHHNTEGMIALCGEHHKKADRKVFSKSQLRDYKNSPTTSEEIRGKFDWAGPRQLIRIGGYYINPHPGLVSRCPGFPSGTLDFRPGSSGLLEVSFSLRSVDGRLLALMDCNTIIAKPSEFESLTINASGTTVKATVQGQKEVLDLETSRLTVEQLEAMLNEDAERFRSFAEKTERDNPTFHARYLLPELDERGKIRGINHMGPPPEAGKRIPPKESHEMYRSYVISTMLRFAQSGYFEGEGIPLLNIRQFRTSSPTGAISILGGVNFGSRGEGFGCAFSGTGIDLRNRER